MDYGRIPQKTEEYLKYGAPEGQRNGALMDAACQLRDAKWEPQRMFEVLHRRGALDGLREAEINATIKSVLSRPPRDEIGHGRTMDRPMRVQRDYNFQFQQPIEEKEPVIYALDEADEIPEPLENPTINFLNALFSPEDKIQIVVAKRNENGGESPVGAMPILKCEEWTKRIESKGGDVTEIFSASDKNGKINQGLYFSINPLREVKEGRKRHNIQRYDHALVEFDTISLKQQWQLIKKSKIPCAAVCYSGNKSLHAIVRVNARDQKQYDERVALLFDHFSEYDVDTQNSDPSRLYRLPGCTRGDTGKAQTLLATNIGSKSWKDWESHITDKFPEIQTQEEFYNEDLSEPPEIIEGLLHRQLSLVIGGSSKTYKSWSLLDMAISTANGVPFWGMNTTQGKCLYINFEIPEYYMRERVKSICDAKGIDIPSDNLYIWNLRGRAQALENIRPKFTRVMANANFAMVILDPIYKTLGNRDENAAGDINSLMNEMEHLALETGAAVVFATHFSKGNQAAKSPIDRISGSGVFARSPDTILVMTEHEEHGCFTVDATVRNFETPEPFVVKMKFPLFERVDELDPQKLKRPGGRPQADDCIPDAIEYLSKLKKGEWLPQQDLVNKMVEQGHSATTVKRQISAAVKELRIEKESSPGRRTMVRKPEKIIIEV